MTLSANPVVEKCFAKLATEVTEQVRDKLIDILIAVLARECEDFDGESMRRLLVAEFETTPLTFAVEKRASGTKTLKEPKEKKTKVVEVDADGNPVKKTRAVKPALSEEERESAKAAKKAEREAERKPPRLPRRPIVKPPRMPRRPSVKPPRMPTRMPTRKPPRLPSWLKRRRKRRPNRQNAKLRKRPARLKRTLKGKPSRLPNKPKGSRSCCRQRATHSCALVRSPH